MWSLDCDLNVPSANRHRFVLKRIIYSDRNKILQIIHRWCIPYDIEWINTSTITRAATFRVCCWPHENGLFRQLQLPDGGVLCINPVDEWKGHFDRISVDGIMVGTIQVKLCRYYLSPWHLGSHIWFTLNLFRTKQLVWSLIRYRCSKWISNY